MLTHTGGSGRRAGRRIRSFCGVCATIVVSLAFALVAAPVSYAAPILPGTVIGSSVLDRAVLSADSITTVLGYGTADEHGSSTEATALVFTPTAPAFAGTRPVVVWGWGTAGVGDSCSASGRFERQDSPTQAVDVSVGFISTLVARGFVVVAPDYIGLGSIGAHRYLARDAEAHAMLDAVRAARATDRSLSERVVMAGHSQGGHAALAAAHAAPSYASDLDVRGVVAFAPASNLESVIPLLRPGIPSIPATRGPAALLVYLLHGLRNSRPDIDVNRFLSPVGRRFVDSAEVGCTPDLRVRLGDVGVGELLAQPLDDPAFVAALDEYVAIPVADWRVPIRIEHGTADTVVPYPASALLSAQLATSGTRNDLSTYPGVGHFDVVAVGADDAVAFIESLVGAGEG